ncbi:MAG: OmpA family protein [Methyloglobulus sp.]|nr:OmpA family protein [Methyloglobulus sp.]
MTPEEINEIRAVVFAALIDYEEMKKTRRVKNVKKVIRGTLAATALSGVGCMNLPDKEHAISQSGSYAKAALASIQKPTAPEMPMSKPIEVGKADTGKALKNKQIFKGVVHFAFDSSALAMTHQDRLDSFVGQLPKNAEIIVVGHTDSNGNPGYNLKLGKKRAQMVAKYLAWRGVTVKSIGSKGALVSRKGWEARRVDIVVNHSSPEKLAITLPPAIQKLAENSKIQNQDQASLPNTNSQKIIPTETAGTLGSQKNLPTNTPTHKPQPTAQAETPRKAQASKTNKQTVTGVVHFPIDSSTLALAHRDRLDSFIRQLPENAELTVLGYTDSKGYSEYNNKLGKQRALTVAKYLAARGVAVLSFGSKRGQPNSDGWASRRVDVIVSHPSATDVAFNLPALAHEVSSRRAKRFTKAGFVKTGYSNRPLANASINKVVRTDSGSVVDNQDDKQSENINLPYDIKSKMTDTGLDEIR